MAGLSAAAAERAARSSDGPLARAVHAEVVRIPHRVIRETTASLERVVLHVRVPGDAAPRLREFVVKCLRADAAALDPHREPFLPSDSPEHPNYWLREFEAFGSPLLDALPAPLRLPRCFARERAARTAEIWLESVPSSAPAAWSDERFAAIARALGAWQSEHPAGRDAASEPAWLARGALRMWAPDETSTAREAVERDELWSSAGVREHLGATVRDRVRACWAARDANLDALERGRQTLVHGDFWTRNLLGAPADAETVAIDWSELGVGALAHDLVNLVLDSVWMFDVPPERLAALRHAALSGYADGFPSADTSTIEAAYRASAHLRFGALAGTLVRQHADESKRREIAARYERPFDEIFATRAAVIRAALEA